VAAVLGVRVSCWSALLHLPLLLLSLPLLLQARFITRQSNDSWHHWQLAE
jgi:hypothetical protein